MGFADPVPDGPVATSVTVTAGIRHACNNGMSFRLNGNQLRRGAASRDRTAAAGIRRSLLPAYRRRGAVSPRPDQRDQHRPADRWGVSPAIQGFPVKRRIRSCASPSPGLPALAPPAVWLLSTKRRRRGEPALALAHQLIAVGERLRDRCEDDGVEPDVVHLFGVGLFVEPGRRGTGDELFGAVVDEAEDQPSLISMRWFSKISRRAR